MTGRKFFAGSLNPFENQVYFHDMDIDAEWAIYGMCLNPFENQVYFHDCYGANY